MDFSKKHLSMMLLGNHEQMCIDYFERADICFLLNRGDETLAQYEASGQSISKHVEFFKTLPLYYQTEDFIFVHAGLKPQTNLHAQSKHDLLWIRDEYQDSDYDWGKTIVTGHTWWNEPVFLENRIIIDTGACYGNYLTACDLSPIIEPALA